MSVFSLNQIKTRKNELINFEILLKIIWERTNSKNKNKITEKIEFFVAF